MTGELDPQTKKLLRKRSRRSFLAGGAVALGGIGTFAWLKTRRLDDNVPWPLRRALEINEQFARDFFDDSRLAPTFDGSLATEPKVNGDVGLDTPIDVNAWRLMVNGGNRAGVPAAGLTFDAIRALPRVEMVTELKCIEGWSTVVRWAGTRFADFSKRYGPDENTQYVGMETPTHDYFVGLDSDSAMHPQTLLAYEMNGAPLTGGHGAPLRLVIPVKYGIKHIKRIGIITYTDDRPEDYWAKQGYDWYAGH
jgi:DMSO/TMAO reductase YedYZ molybdopterin-dependent catalytic subunit